MAESAVIVVIVVVTPWQQWN